MSNGNKPSMRHDLSGSARTLVMTVGLAGALPGFLLAGCNPPPSAEDLAKTRGGRVEVYFNEPGTRRDNMWHSDAVQVMIELVESAEDSIEMAVMGFYYEPLVDAFIDAHDRGVDIRMVGDAGHWYNDGYLRFDDRQIPIVTGNLAHIMHDKFMIVDDRFIWSGTANWTDTDLNYNSNNFIYIDSPEVAADFYDEWEQMFNGVYGHGKTEVDNGRVYEVGDTTVEVWFSPNEDSMGRILETIDEVEQSLRFTIFAFTKDQVGGAFIRKQAELDVLNAADGLDGDDVDFRDKRSVAGVVCKSQLHSNNQYHEAYRLLSSGIPLRLDGNDNSKQPGDYQAGGGRLHSKTMIMDVGTDTARVLTGSFNWSSSATVSNDEFMFILHGERIANQFDDYFEDLWVDGKQMGEAYIGEDELEEGDIVINEVMWYGGHSGDLEGFDEFIELRNLTDENIKLDMWQISNPDDFVVGLPPGSTIPANGTFLIVDHVMEPYEDGVPQDEQSAYTTGDLVVNSFNDNRQSRLYLKDGNLELILKDPRAQIMDVAGDGSAAFAGGPDRDGRVYSMERRSDPGDGSLEDSWYTCTADEGGANVNDHYKDEIIATPGESNSLEP